MSTKLINCAVPTRDIDASKDFYEALLGVEFGRSMSEYFAYYAWASAGVKITVHTPDWKSAGVVLTFAVDDLSSATQKLSEAGGEIYQENIDVPIPKAIQQNAYAKHFEELGLCKAADVTNSLGRMSLLRDPAKNMVILLQVHEYAKVLFERGDLTKRDFALHDAECKISREYN